MVSRHNWTEGTCGRCGRHHYRPRGVSEVICYCHMLCPDCGGFLEEYKASDIDEKTYRRAARKEGEPSEVSSIRRGTRWCPVCEEYYARPPVEVKLS